MTEAVTLDESASFLNGRARFAHAFPRLKASPFANSNPRYTGGIGHDDRVIDRIRSGQTNPTSVLLENSC